MQINTAQKVSVFGVILVQNNSEYGDFSRSARDVCRKRKYYNMILRSTTNMSSSISIAVPVVSSSCQSQNRIRACQIIVMVIHHFLRRLEKKDCIFFHPCRARGSSRITLNTGTSRTFCPPVTNQEVRLGQPALYVYLTTLRQKKSLPIIKFCKRRIWVSKE